MPSSLGYSAPVLYGALVGVPEICLAETIFLWIFSLSVFSLIWSVNPGFMCEHTIPSRFPLLLK